MQVMRRNETMKRSTAYSLFLVMCVVWGLTWIAIKVGVASIPPLLFAGTRFVTAGAILLVWGMRHVASGLAAVLNLAFMPIALFTIGLAYGEERFTARQLVAVALGVVGLVALFRPASGTG